MKQENECDNMSENKLNKEKIILKAKQYLENGVPLAIFLEKYPLSYIEMSDLVVHLHESNKLFSEKQPGSFSSISSESYILNSHGKNSSTPNSAMFQRVGELRSQIAVLKSNPETTSSLKEIASYQNEINTLREELIVRHIKLVNWTLKNFFNNIPLSSEDTQLFGIEGLVIALNNYDYKEGEDFSIYAISTIVSTIKKHFKELYGLTWHEYLTSENHFDNRLINHEPLPEEDNEYSQTSSDLTEELAELHILREELTKSLSSLTPLEALVIIKRYGLDDEVPLTVKQTSELLHISYEKVRDIELKALKNLHHPKISSHLRTYIDDYEEPLYSNKKM